MLRTGRLFPESDFTPLMQAETRPACVSWRLDVNGRQRPCLKPTPPASLVVPLQPPWYIDLDEYAVGILDVPGSEDNAVAVFKNPQGIVAGAYQDRTATGEEKLYCITSSGRQSIPAGTVREFVVGWGARRIDQ